MITPEQYEAAAAVKIANDELNQAIGFARESLLSATAKRVQAIQAAKDSGLQVREGVFGLGNPDEWLPTGAINVDVAHVTKLS